MQPTFDRRSEVRISERNYLRLEIKEDQWDHQPRAGRKKSIGTSLMLCTGGKEGNYKSRVSIRRQDMFSLSERPGWLRLKAFRPLAADKLLKVGNTLSQRSFRSNGNEVTVKIDISHISEDTHAGLCHFAQHSGCLGVAREGGQTYLELRLDDRIESRQPINSTTLWLRSTWGLDGLSHFYYSLDGDLFAPFGDYPLSWGYYRGDRIGIYCYNNRADEGYIDIDYLHYQNM